MNIIINTSSMIPIYEQIVEAIKQMIISKELQDGDPLPSVRTLSKELKISALTVKKAYDCLEEEGLTSTIHGKGTYVTGVNLQVLKEAQRQQIEAEMEKVVMIAREYGLENEEIKEILDLILEDTVC